MESNLSNAASLLGIGMITVFLVLFLVVVTGKILIRVVNRFAKEVESQISNSTNPKHIAAITAAVEVFTNGKGKITNIENSK